MPSKRTPADQLLPSGLTIAVRVLTIVFIAVPVLYMILLALSPNTLVASGGASPTHLTTSNFVGLWSTAPVLRGLINSIAIAGIAAIIAVALGTCAAYPLARLRFRGNHATLYGLLGIQTIPGVTLVLPLFIVLASVQTLLGVHLLGQYPVVILTYMTFGLPLSTWLLFLYFRSIPRDLEQAALVDGCSRFGTLWRILVPLAKPVIVVSMVFAFLVGWNDIVFASVFTNASSATVAVVLQQFAGSQATSSAPLYGQLMAAALISGIPVVALYLAFQRYLISGLSAGSLSGT